ncbi:MAG: DUF6544 family protein [Cyclobacteriaceae bacterium]
MRYLFVLLIAIHGLIHLMGFAKAFGLAQISQLTKEISQPTGVVWLVATLLFIATSVLFLLTKDAWWSVALISVLLSQVLVILYWQDAKYGTIANVIILLIAVPVWAQWRFENQYKKEVVENLHYSNSLAEPILTHEAISQLPDPVQRYIVYSGAINKPVIKNFRIEFDGQIRSDEKSEWMPFTTDQHNFIDQPIRLFFMKATMKGLPVFGYHSFKNGIAVMDIRLLSLFKVQYQAGKEMDIAETVTWFNDLCLFAPAGLIDKRILWTAIDSLTSKATFTNKNISISALLYFNNKGELINFVSDDRYRIASDEDRKVVRFSTPVKNYVEHNGRKYPAYGEAIWNLPEGDLIYGQFNTKEVEYNAKD